MEWEEVEPSCNSHLNILYVFMTNKQVIQALLKKLKVYITHPS